MGYFGGLAGFAVAFLAVLGVTPLTPWIWPALSLAFTASVIGVVLSLALAPLMGALYAGGIGVTRLAAAVFVVVVFVLTSAAWQPVVLAMPVARWLYLSLTGAALALTGLLVVLFLQLALSGIAYAVAATAYLVGGQSPLEAEARGACAGVNAAMNLLLGLGVMGPYLFLTFSPVFALILFLIAMAGIIAASTVPFRRNPATGIVSAADRTAIGWLVWLLPTSWLLELLGLFLFMFTLLLHATLGLFSPMLTMTGMDLRSDTGSIIVTGGIAANLNPAPTFNIGTFTFVRTITPALIPIYNDAAFVGFEVSVQNHEIGHQLNLAAFGTAFNLAGFVDQWLGSALMGPGYAIYGEDLATTNDPSVPAIFTTPLNMWVI